MKLNNILSTKMSMIVLLFLALALFAAYLIPTVLFIIVFWSIGGTFLNQEIFKNEIKLCKKLKIILLLSVTFFAAAGFVWGFFPVESPQGPLIGAVITGPSGAILGFLIFFIIASLLKPKK